VVTAVRERSCGGLTVKLRGRTATPDRRRGRTLSPSARGAKQTTHHGPLQRLLDDMASEHPPCVGGQKELGHEKPKHEVT
jgi:hypothetical protein